MVNPLHFLTAKQKHVQLQDSHEAAISPNIAWLNLNHLEKLSWLTLFIYFLNFFKQNPNTQKTSTQSAIHFIFQGVEEDWTTNEQSPLVVEGIQFVGRYHH